MTNATHSIQSRAECALNYSHVAQSYEASRPEYPVEAIELFIKALGIDKTMRIVDIGAGTGKLTREMIKQGQLNPDKFTALEPSAEMVKNFRLAVSGVKIFQRPAENTQLTAKSADVIVAGTAFHWFKGRDALKEFSRILTAKGRLGLIWNLLDPQVEWVHKARSLLDEAKPAINHDTSGWQAAFTETEFFTDLQEKHITYHYTQASSFNDLARLLLSFKSAANWDETKKAEFKTKLRQILDQNPDTSGKEIFSLPYRVEMYICTKKPVLRLSSLNDEADLGAPIPGTPSADNCSIFPTDKRVLPTQISDPGPKKKILKFSFPTLKAPPTLPPDLETSDLSPKPSEQIEKMLDLTESSWS